ncbi:MAG: FMN reductase [Phenylobacterium sp.]|uniref:NADPH-dependent FMN reductase n=1 Tax=Phenylobacterium sp. TaxID=1871053 RepID=UPI0025D3B661|nr:NADPH-dependent FMN reductase [Phenylobacterium sp.]MBI1196784.1 FMN reductase [Phenylobacterium sp.]
MRPGDARAPPGAQRPLIVGLGGTTRAGSSTERLLRRALRLAEAGGARVELFAGDDLALPHYAPERPARDSAAARLVEALRAADGLLIASPGYHGSISGLVKNALDYAEDLRGDPRPYFEGRAVGCIAGAYGWQAANSTLSALRAVVHALRGWPTPLGVAANSAVLAFDPEGACVDDALDGQLSIMVGQVLWLARAA